MHRLRRLIALLALGSAAAALHAEPQACRLPGIRHAVLCGSVVRPLDPRQPDGRTIEVRYALVPALARHKRPDPVVLLAGGPGQSAIALAGAVLPLLQRLNNRRDLLFIDQRGTGGSAPLVCDPPAVGGVAAQFDVPAQRRALARCRDRLQRELGSDDALRFFTTSIAVGDIDAVRRQLGIERLNLIGVSYGTRVALEMMRRFPGTVRRAVLDGVAPPDMALPASQSVDAQAALDAMFAACEREAACRQAHPRLRADWLMLLARLPQPVRLRDPRSGRIEELQLDRELLLGAVRATLYVPAYAAALPAAIAEAAAGRFEPLMALATLVTPDPARDGRTDVASGMHFSVICSEDLPRLQAGGAAAGSDFGAATRELYRAICVDWPRGEVEPAFYRIEPADMPVLLLSGGLDPVTPPRHGERVAVRLGATASHRVIEHAGHGVLSIGCVRDVVYRFIDADSAASALAVDSRCAEAIPRPPAFMPPRLEVRR